MRPTSTPVSVFTNCAAKATAAWLARADAHLAAQRAVDQLAAHAVALLGATNSGAAK